MDAWRAPSRRTARSSSSSDRCWRSWPSRSGERALLSENNLNSIFSGNAYVAVAAIGMSMVIIAGHIDVSVGSLIGVLATISGTLAFAVSDLGAWLASIVAGIAIQAVNGVLVAYAPNPSHRRDPGIALDPEGRAHQRDLGRLDHQPARRVSFSPSSASSGFLPRSGSPPSSPWWRRCGCAIPRWAGRSTRSAASGRRARRRHQTKRPSCSSSRCTALRRDRGHPVREPATSHPVDRSANLELNVITASVIGGVSILGGTGTVIGSTLAAVLFAAIGSSLIFLNDFRLLAEGGPRAPESS